ncbi:MAG: T9SS type A sorting domain-containing protein [Flavobacteriales bacterium]
MVFSIAPDAGLVPGRNVSNTANIYFDFNEPVITEPAVFGVEVGTSIATQEASMFRAYPNPVEDELFMQWPGGGAVRFELLDATGRRIRTGAGCCGTGSLNMKGIAPGAYLLRMIAGSTIRDLRVIHR